MLQIVTTVIIGAGAAAAAAAAAAAVVPSSQLFTYANLHETDIKACRASSNNSVTMYESCTLPVLNYCVVLGDFFQPTGEACFCYRAALQLRSSVTHRHRPTNGRRELSAMPALLPACWTAHVTILSALMHAQTWEQKLYKRPRSLKMLVNADGVNSVRN